ncbi:MAG TPA: hypothetical protein VN377_05500 [Candidatus Thermoplasmatota archaeon]|nr:hypothetical protein [Candidatus Thermoplasmatota archaeon]
MNIVPLVSIKNTKLFDGKEGNSLLPVDVSKRVEKDSLLYVLDLDGIERNNPNLELYQRLAEHNVLWIDNGPRRIDDVMDTIMAGATNITLREESWPTLDMPAVQDLTDDEIYLDKTKQYQEQKILQQNYSGEIGTVLFNEEVLYGVFSKERTANQKIYLYTGSLDKIQLWTEQGISGIIIDLNKKQGGG